MSAWYNDLHIDIANEDRIRTVIYDKKNYFNFPTVNILFICSIIPVASVSVVYISQFVFILNFLNRGLLLTRKLLNQGLQSRPFLVHDIIAGFQTWVARQQVPQVTQQSLTYSEHLSSSQFVVRFFLFILFNDMFWRF